MGPLAGLPVLGRHGVEVLQGSPQPLQGDADIRQVEGHGRSVPPLPMEQAVEEEAGLGQDEAVKPQLVTPRREGEVTEAAVIQPLRDTPAMDWQAVTEGEGADQWSRLQ